MEICHKEDENVSVLIPCMTKQDNIDINWERIDLGLM